MLLPLFMKNPADNKSYFTREDIFEQLSKLSAVPQPSSKYTIIFNPSDRQYFTNGRNTFEINYDNCSKMSSRVKYDLLSAGFFINNGKSIWLPTRNLTWLGFI
jgi:hypothetical protein